MDLSIIIVNWNTKDMLRKCLASLTEYTNSKYVKVIVVDNGSKDASSEMVQSDFPGVCLINSGGNIGFSRANNLAIPHADTQFILFLNPDTIVLKDSITQMVDYMESNPSIGALGCKMKYPDGEVQPLGLQWFPTPIVELFSCLFISGKTIEMFKYYLPYHDPNQSGYVAKLYGGCLMVRKSVLDQVGYFDERFFMYCEDMDLCYRILKSGWKLYYLSEAEIIHFVGGASDNASSQFSTLMMCESISKFIYKYHGSTGKLFYIISVFSTAHFRLLMLGFLKLISYITPPARPSINYGDSFNKYFAMIKWSVNLQRPIIKNE